MSYQRYVRTATALSVLILILGNPTLPAQDQGRTRFGLYGGGILISHLADFPYLPGTTGCCLRFGRGSGFGIATGGLFEYPIGALLLGTRLGYSRWPFEFTTDEGTFLIIDGIGMEGTFQHRLLGTYATVDVIPTIGFRYVDRFHFMAGFRVGFPLFGSFEQYEQIVRPETKGTFLNADGTDSHARVRNRFSGTIPDLTVQLAPLGGVFWELPMNDANTLLLVPEVWWQFGITDVAAGADWKVGGLYVGLGLKYQTGSDESIGTEGPGMPVVSVDSLQDSGGRAADIVDPDDQFTASISAVAVGANGEEYPVAQISVEEFSSTLMTPLLPYIFFDENSSSIPDRYNGMTSAEAREFRIDTISATDGLATYYNLLNIIGTRLNEYPSAAIRLTGTNQDRDGEAGDTSLSTARAESVRAYLVDVWNIDSSRISVTARNLPEKAAASTEADGSAENRRVEIASPDPRILHPVISRDTLRRVNPPVILLRPEAADGAEPVRWTITVTQDGSLLQAFDGEGDLPSEVEWRPERRGASMPLSEDNLEYTLRTEGVEGGETSAIGRIGVEQVTIRKKRLEGTGDVEIDRFSLILFDVRSSELLALHDPIIELIREYIRPNSTITVTGYTDRLGESAYNQRLAEARAEAVARVLRSEAIDVSSVGEADLYGSTLPEARLYTRIVEVVIETPRRP